MDLAFLAVIALIISVPVVIWDLATANSDSPAKQNMLPYTQSAYLVLFIAGFGLLLKFMSFAAVMLLATAVTGLIWGWERMFSRREALTSAERNVAPSEDRSNNDLVRSQPRAADEPARSQPRAAEEPARSQPRSVEASEPIWLELGKSFFPVILIVFLIRSFLVEPFKIPSGSMVPTLLVGDFILVNKFAYGIRLPVANTKLVEVGQPQRGDVMVFRYPVDPSVDYIKRVVGLPGDTVAYRGKQLTINGQPIAQTDDGDYSYLENGLSLTSFRQLKENLSGREHATLINPEAPSVMLAGVRQFPFRERCEYNDEGFSCTVPSGHYFTMGDNRDSSSDSRYWGFVPEDNIVGKAFLIWMNFGQLKRIGHSIY